MKIKILFILIGGIVIITGIALVAYISSKKTALPPSQPSSRITKTVIPTEIPTVIPTIANLSPEDVTKTFYTWYISYPGKAFASGAFKTSPYLSEEFKHTNINSMQFIPYGPATYDPLFCTANRKSAFYIGKAVYDTSGKIANVMIQENNSFGRNLYQVTLIKMNNSWLIDDTNCEQ